MECSGVILSQGHCETSYALIGESLNVFWSATTSSSLYINLRRQQHMIITWSYYPARACAARDKVISCGSSTCFWLYCLEIKHFFPKIIDVQEAFVALDSSFYYSPLVMHIHDHVNTAPWPNRNMAPLAMYVYADMIRYQWLHVCL